MEGPGLAHLIYKSLITKGLRLVDWRALDRKLLRIKDLRNPCASPVLRRRLEAEFGGPGTRQFIKVLRLLEGASPGELTRAVEGALELGVADADAVRLILEHRREQP